MTTSNLEWNLSREDFAESEDAMIDTYGKLREAPRMPPDHRTLPAIVRWEEGDTILDDDLEGALLENCTVSAIETKEKVLRLMQVPLRKDGELAWKQPSELSHAPCNVL